MEKLIGNFSTFPLWKKALIFVGLPLLALIFILRGLSSIGALLNGGDRKRTDDESAKLDAKIEATTGEIKRSEGKVDQLEEDKKDAIADAKNDSPTDYYNDRYKPDGK